MGQVNKTDLKKIAWDTVIFFAPAILIYLGQIQGTLTNNGILIFRDLIPSAITLGAIYAWLIGILINIFLKLRDGRK